MHSNKTISLSSDGVDWLIDVEVGSNLILFARCSTGIEESWEPVSESKIPDNVLIQLYRATSKLRNIKVVSS